VTVWDFLDKRWPRERTFVTVLLYGLIIGLLQMAADNPGLWKEEVFKVILQALALTGFLNMLMAFHFSANKSDEVKANNTTLALQAINTAQAGSDAKPETKADVEG
jgi:hypothetical protein